MDAKNLALARKTLERIQPAERQNYEGRLLWALLLALEGKRAEARKNADDATLQYAGIAPFSTLLAAEYFSLCGETAEAFDWLEKAVRNGDERDEWFQRDRKSVV